mgnify:CR=1 FL=1
MNFKPIIVVAGEPRSIFFEIFFKALKFKKIKSPIILICSLNLLKNNMKKFNFKKKINNIQFNSIKEYQLKNKSLNLINVKLNNYNSINKKKFVSKKYIERSFEIAFSIIKMGITDKLINGPISKKTFLKGKFPGITEFVANKFKIKKNAMLIFNKNISVCPITTHIPLKFVAKKINKKIIKEKIYLINNFFQKKLKSRPKIAVLGLNPHCESFDKNDEDKNIILPTINELKKKKIKISGPYPADTIFLKKNRDQFDVIVGMYHDQVLSPLKTIFEYDAINITLGLPFIRISPDHGPNEKMINKNLSNPLSLINALSFLDKKN